MTLGGVEISPQDARTAIAFFRVTDGAPVVRFGVRLATPELALLVCRSIAKRYGMRKRARKLAWWSVS